MVNIAVQQLASHAPGAESLSLVSVKMATKQMTRDNFYFISALIREGKDSIKKCLLQILMQNEPVVRPTLLPVSVIARCDDDKTYSYRVPIDSGFLPN